MNVKNACYATLLLANFSFAQLPDGSIAPDFTLTDINGNSQHLYSYLDQGKTVYIDFFATHCPFCWSYHNTHSLSDLYDQHGPGTISNDVMVFAIDLDQNNGTNEFYGISGVTQGDWVAGTNYPQLNPEGAALTAIVNDFDATFYPLIYAICPDRTITQIGKQTSAVLYQHVGTCASLGIPEDSSPEYSLRLLGHKQVQISSPFENSRARFELFDLQGKSIMNGELGQTIDMNSFQSGLYLLNILSEEGKMARFKFVLPND